jgi:exosortase O
MLLPFGSILDLYIGFPLRIISVNLVSIFFEFLSIDYLSTDTIITIENNSSQVDFSCSGIKGLWAALVFYITNTWLKGYKINFRWFLIGGLLMSLILFLNTVRILILVYFDLVLMTPRISDILHVPLGVFGFVFSCVVTYFLSEYLLQTTSPELPKKSEINHVYYFSNMFILLPLLQIVISLNTNQHDSIKLEKSDHSFESDFLEHWNFNSVNLSNEETKFMEVHGGHLDKFYFNNEGIKGNGFVLKSKTWRSHHSPEYCITSGGREIIKSGTLKMNSGNTIKSIVLRNGQQGYYWFQHNTFTTDDFGTRVWKEFFHQKTDWFLVCIIFDSNKNLDQKERFIKKITTQLKSKV